MSLKGSKVHALHIWVQLALHLCIPSIYHLVVIILQLSTLGWDDNDVFVVIVDAEDICNFL